ncbi:MAG: alpha/beta fold hydrolase, partial [Cyanobium sp.]
LRPDHWRDLFAALAPEPRVLGLLQVTAPAAAPAPEGSDGSALESLLSDSQTLPTLARAVLEHSWPAARPRLWWLSEPPPAEACDSAALAGALAQGLGRGFGRCLALEHPDLWGGWLEIEGLETAAGARLLSQELRAVSAGAAMAGDAELAVRWSGGGRLVERLGPIAAPSAAAAEGPLDGLLNSQVLISGGLGSLGLATAAWLVERGAAGLLLLGRQAPSAPCELLLEGWRRRGTAIRVLQGDVGDPALAAKIEAALEESGLPLHGIIHAAGVLEDSTLERLDASGWQRVLQPKIAGAWQLHQLSLGQPLRFFVLYASLAGLLGSPGQSAYGAANAGLDALASHRRRLGLPALSVNWGPWSGAGMAAQGHERSGRSLESFGVLPLAPERYLSQLAELLRLDEPSLISARMDLPRLAGLLAGRPQASLLAALLPAPSTRPAAAAGHDTSLRASLLAAAPQERVAPMLGYLQRSLARLLGLEEAPIDPELHLLEAAADSLMVMDAISQIQKDLGLMLYPREIYEHPRVGSLAQYLADAFNRSLGEGAGAPEAAAMAELPAALQLPASLRGPRPAPERPLPAAVFVLSSPRAGSTLLRVMLAGHPQLFSPPELHLLPFSSMGERAEALGPSHLGGGLERALIELEGADADHCRRLLRTWEQEDRPVQWVYGRLQELAGGRLLVDKSPTYALHPETLAQAEALFDQPRYIHLIRHPYAVIRSFVDLRMQSLFGVSDGDPHRLAETIWRVCNRNVQELRQRLGEERVLLLRYEDLVGHPATELARLCAFLGIPFDDALLSPYEGRRLTDGPHRQSLSVGDPNFGRHKGIDASLAEAWRAVTLPWPLDPATQELARTYGYCLPREDAARGQATPVEPPATPAPADRLPERREAMLEVGGLRLCRCEWGPEDGPPVLCLHGLLDQGLIWEPLAAPLAAAGFRVIAPDLRGHGRSDHVGPGGSYQPLDFIGDLVGLVDQLLDRPFLLVGHSLGTVVASGLTSLREPLVERLVLIEPVLPGAAGSQNVRETVSTLVTYALEPPRHSVMPDRAAAAARLQRALPALDPALASRLVERVTVPQGEGWVWSWDAVLQTRMSLNLQSGPLHRTAYLQLLEGLRPPLTVFQGSSSAFNRPEDLSDLDRALSRAERRLIHGGHTLMIDNPGVLGAGLLQALGAPLPR